MKKVKSEKKNNNFIGGNSRIKELNKRKVRVLLRIFVYSENTSVKEAKGSF